MMIQEKLNNLYKKEKDPRFVPCGLVDEKSYTKSRTKVLWFLKEPNDPPKENHSNDRIEWTLPKYIIKYIITEPEKNWKNNKMWKVVGALSYGMQQPSFPYFTTSYEEDNVCKGLEMIGVTNLKKSGGGGSSKQDKIKIAVEDDSNKKLWTEEIRIMAPDLVICGGTYGYIKDLLSFSEVDLPIQSGWYKYYAVKNLGTHQCTFLDFYHPAYRISPALLYAFFKDCVQELRNKKRFP